MSKSETTRRRGRGRPRHEIEQVHLNYRLDADLYGWLRGSRGKLSVNQYINDIIREKAGL